MSSAPYDILPTPYGGRGAYARQAIPKGSPILFCTAPYAGVIFWKFRREVCASCYAYSFESGRSKWSVKLGGEKGQGGVWFCSEDCKRSHLKENELSVGRDIGWRLEIVGALEKLVVRMGKVEGQQNGPKLYNLTTTNPLAFLEGITTSDITKETIERAWSVAEAVSSEECRKKAAWTEILNEFELDTAQFVLDGLIRKAIEENYLLSPIFADVPSGMGRYCLGAGRWTDFIQLQDSELALTRSKPYLLASRILVYRFLRHLVASLPSRTRQNKKAETSEDGPSTPSVCIVNTLQRSLATSADARALMARDYGNVFGIWDNAKQEEGSEMLGWGVYVFGSYFNHNCGPNLKKIRDKRGIQFHTLKDIAQGEELCISYIDEESLSVKERGEHLARDWFFTCSCARCTAELRGAPTG